MLQSLDVLIALVTYITICSLFVLIIVQIVSAALSLRGKNMANALALTFQTIDPTLREKAQDLAQHILCDPLLSDSIHTPKGRCAKGAAAAQRMLPVPTGNLLAKVTSFKLANAIRADEVYDALRKLAAANATEVEKSARSVIDGIAGTSPKADEIKQKIAALGAIAGAVTDPATKAEILKGIGNASANILQEIDSARERFEKWCGSAQDRAEQWFRTHTRGITIAVSIVFTLVCQIDGVELYKLVSTNSAAREALLQASKQMLDKEDYWTGQPKGLPNRVADEWNRRFPTLPIVVSESSGIADVRMAVEVATGGDKVAAARKTADEAVTSTSEAAKASGATDAMKKAAEDAAAKAMDLAELQEGVTKKLDAIERDQAAAFNKEQEERLASLKKEAEASGYPIIANGGWRWKKTDEDWAAGLGTLFWHLPGIALFAALLTLGAPYWFNMLKNLASLRPALSQLIEGEEQREKPGRK